MKDYASVKYKILFNLDVGAEVNIVLKKFIDIINNMRYLGILIETKLLKMISPGHEVRPWSYHTVDSVYSLRGKAGNHFQLLVIELLSGSRGLVVLSPAWKTTRSEFDSQCDMHH